MLLVCFAASPATAHAVFAGQALLDDVDALDRTINSSGKSAAHSAKAKIFAQRYTQTVKGIPAGTLLSRLDCVSTRIQMARARSARSNVAKAKACQAALLADLAGTAAVGDLRTIGARIDEIAARVKARRVFGSKATALRRLTLAFVKRHFNVAGTGFVRLPVHFEQLECVDVKLEAGRTSGASSCARKLRRLLLEQKALHPNPPITFGSDMMGDPVAIAGVYREDTEFWTKGLTVPQNGTVTTFRLRIGSDPKDLPLRFSVVRPEPDGRVKVITTTDPPYPLPGNRPGTYEFKTSALSFRCCKVLKGDIVTVDNSGAGEEREPYVWFARKPGFTVFSHTMGGPSQNPGMIWTGTPHDGYDLLMQVVMVPD